MISNKKKVIEDQIAESICEKSDNRQTAIIQKKDDISTQPDVQIAVQSSQDGCNDDDDSDDGDELLSRAWLEYNKVWIPNKPKKVS